MAVLGFANTIPFLILGTVVIVAGTFVQHMFARARGATSTLQGRTGDQVVGEQVLPGFDDVKQDCRDDTRLRNRGTI